MGIWAGWIWSVALVRTVQLVWVHECSHMPCPEDKMVFHRWPLRQLFQAFSLANLLDFIFLSYIIVIILMSSLSCCLLPETSGEEQSLPWHKAPPFFPCWCIKPSPPVSRQDVSPSRRIPMLASGMAHLSPHESFLLEHTWFGIGVHYFFRIFQICVYLHFVVRQAQRLSPSPLLHFSPTSSHLPPHWINTQRHRSR